MTQDILDRLKIYAELEHLSSVAIHPEMPGYSTGRLWGDARDASAEIMRLRAEVEAFQSAKKFFHRMRAAQIKRAPA